MTTGAKSVFRWIVLLPAAIAGAIAARVVVILINVLSMDFGFNPAAPDSFLGRAFLTWIGGSIMGISGVWIAFQVAPRHRRVSATAVCALLLLLAGAALFASILTRDGWGIWDSVALAIGALGMTAAVWSESKYAAVDPRRE